MQPSRKVGMRPFKLATLRPPARQAAGVSVNRGTNLVPVLVVMLQDPAIGQRAAIFENIAKSRPSSLLEETTAAR